MRLRSVLFVSTFGLCVAAPMLWWRSPAAKRPLVLSFKIGQTFEEVVKASSYPVVEYSNIPTRDRIQAGETFVTEPAVVLVFNDPEHGFKLPATRFAMIGYTHNKVETVATSPMLEELPFDQAVAILENLQIQFKAGGWEPWIDDGSAWFDFTAEGKKRLYARMFDPEFSKEATLRVPGKYGMTFRLWCADGCMTRQPPYRFMIDVGVSSDIEGRIQSRRSKQ